MGEFVFREQASWLVSQMTLEEKVSQMVHKAAAVEHLDIPSYNWWNEALHGVARAGVATMFPQAIGLAATFDTALVGRVAEVISDEARAKFHAFQEEDDHDIYKGLTFWAPNINIFRDPRWGRGHETYGEDPYLTSALGVAFIHGMQGDDPKQLKTAACAKHFAVHSGPEAERHSFNATCDEYDLWNTYLPAFEVAVKQGRVEAVMGAYNRTLGEPCCGSPFLLQTILREKWGFDGHVVSDCWAVKDFHENHKITASALESVVMAVKAGCDINCGSLFSLLVEAVQTGMIEEELIDQAVERLMVTRMKLGLLDAPENPAYTSIPYEIVDSPEHRAFNLQVARRSLVLLKNDGCLPLDKDAIRTIGVIGPNADNRRALEGNYEGTASEHITPLMGLREVAGQEGIRVLYAEGSHLMKDRVSNLAEHDDRVAEARIVAKRSDAVVVCLGLDADVEGEEGDEGNQYAGGDKPDLELPGRQQALLEEVVDAANGKPVILVLVSGSAMAVSWADEHVNGIFQAFYPGAMGGLALAEAILGRYSPSGKLPVTFYRSTADLPDFHDYSMNERTYRYFTGEPLYPFGFGLGYARFEALELTPAKDTCRVRVRNAGCMQATNTVQVYVKSPGQKELYSLCGALPVTLPAGGEQTVEIPLNPLSFSRFNAEGDAELVSGTHTLYAAFHQPDARSCQLSGQQPLVAEITV